MSVAVESKYLIHHTHKSSCHNIKPYILTIIAKTPIIKVVIIMYLRQIFCGCVWGFPGDVVRTKIKKGHYCII